MDIDKILIVDDELIIRRTLEEYCHRARIKAKSVASVEEGLEILQNSEEGFDLLLLDVNLPDGDGLEILEELQSLENPPLAVMITGQGSIESAVECMKLGAYDYLLKPFSNDQIDMVLRRAAKFNTLVNVNKGLVLEMSSYSEHGIVGKSTEVENLKAMIDRVARTDATVLIHGETGTGKELIAQSIHQSSLRRDKPFIRVNCAAVTETLIESEFFGHEKGAFTGALQSRIGRFELADGGTLLLDEISEVSLSLQAKLLRVLQENELERVGGTKTIKVDVRILATTNRDLYKTVQDGKFREDLYYRLNVFPIESPSLNKRTGDVPLLARHFLKGIAQKHGASCKDFTPRAYQLMEAYKWPGNVRELQNVVERAIILNGNQTQIDASVFPLEIQIAKDGRPVRAEAPFEAKTESSNSTFADISEEAEQRTSVAATATAIMPNDDGQNEDWSLESMERKLILETLRRTGGNRTKSAEMMQVSIRTLFNKLNQYKKNGFTEFEPYINS